MFCGDWSKHCVGRWVSWCNVWALEDLAMLKFLDYLFSKRPPNVLYAWEGLVATKVAREATRTLQSTSLATRDRSYDPPRTTPAQIPLPVDAMDWACSHRRRRWQAPCCPRRLIWPSCGLQQFGLKGVSGFIVTNTQEQVVGRRPAIQSSNMLTTVFIVVLLWIKIYYERSKQALYL